MQTYVRFFLYVVSFTMGVSFAAVETPLPAGSSASPASVPLLDAPIAGLLFSPLSYDDIFALVGSHSLAETFYAIDNKRAFSTSSILGDFPFDALIARMPHANLKHALAQYKEGDSAPLLAVLVQGTVAEQRAAMACCAAMLGSVVNTLATRNVVDGVMVCVNLIQLYEHVEQLPIEQALQAMRCLYARICKMLEQLYGKEDGFIGWLKHKWVYLPIVVIIIMLRIAKFYWGGQQSGQFSGGYYGGYNNFGGGQSYTDQFNEDALFGQSNHSTYGFATRHEGISAAHDRKSFHLKEFYV